MKSNDVIAIKEGVISDIGNKMFGGGKKADKKGNSNRQPAPQIGDGGTTSTKRLAKKLFVQDFVADVVSSLQAGINSGLILPPKAHHADKTLDEGYNKLDTVLENIIKEAPLEVNSNYGSGEEHIMVTSIFPKELEFSTHREHYTRGYENAQI